MDLRLWVRRAGACGVGTRIIRFQGSLLGAHGRMAVYVTPEHRLVFYRRPGGDTDGGYWVFPSLAEAVSARDEEDRPLVSPELAALLLGQIN